MISLTGKTALVTGAAKRLGRAIALSLAHEGVGVVLHYRSSREAVEEVAGAVRALGVKAWVLKADFAQAGEAESLVDRAIDAAGPLDFLINNASMFAQAISGPFAISSVLLVFTLPSNSATRRLSASSANLIVYVKDIGTPLFDK